MNKKIRKIAFIYKLQSQLNNNRVVNFRDALEKENIECRIFDHSVNLIDSDFIPDCVIISDLQEAKLTPYPTYGILNDLPAFTFSRKRFVRNILTYDGYLTSSSMIKKTLEDTLFSARKLGSGIKDFLLSPAISSNAEIDFTNADAAIILERTQVKNLPAILRNLNRQDLVTIYSYKDTDRQNLARFPELPGEGSKFTSGIFRKHGAGICLNSCNDLNSIISYQLLEIIASGAIAITNYSEYLHGIFGDNLLYIPNHYNQKECIRKIRQHTDWIRQNPGSAAKKAKQACDMLRKRFSIKQQLDILNELHQETLVSKGYILPPEERTGDLPSVSYIMRTGGEPEYINRTLDSLANQSFPGIEVIFVLYKPLKNLEEIKKRYKGKLKFRVVEDFGQLRSTGITTGMKNIDTDYFGMIDDDDTIHPNHVYTMIKTLQYHNNLDWRGEVKLAYSGSYYDSEAMGFGESPEWHDEFLEHSPKRRMVEHFRFYDPDLMAQNQWYMMSNSWLAHKSLIDHELVRDTETHSHEDLYFEQQFALRTFFAFSCEMTAAHFFHGQNSTIVDKHRNETDVFRHMVSMHLRLFPTARFYRTYCVAEQNAITAMAVPQAPEPKYLEGGAVKHMKYNEVSISSLYRKFRYVIQTQGKKAAIKKVAHYVLKTNK